MLGVAYYCKGVAASEVIIARVRSVERLLNHAGDRLQLLLLVASTSRQCSLSAYLLKHLLHDLFFVFLA